MHEDEQLGVGRRVVECADGDVSGGGREGGEVGQQWGVGFSLGGGVQEGGEFGGGGGAGGEGRDLGDAGSGFGGRLGECCGV